MVVSKVPKSSTVALLAGDSIQTRYSLGSLVLGINLKK